MAAQIGSLYVSLTMNSGPYNAAWQRAQTATARGAAVINRDVGLANRTIQNFTGSAGNRSFRPYAIIAASRSYETAADRANLLRGSLLSVTAVAGGFAAALGTNLVSRYADTMVNLTNQLRTVSDNTADLTALQKQLSAVSDRSRSSLQSSVTLYARTARATEHLGLSQQKLLRITETVQKAFSIGGATSAEAQGAAIQLAQGIASDRFSGEEYRSISENAPVLLRGIAESIGVTIGKLREMAHAGELTADVVTLAILKATDRIDREFGETVVTIDRAITLVDNKVLQYLGSVDKAYGASHTFAQGILAIGDNLDAIVPTLTNVAALVGAIFLARNRGALGGGAGAIAGGIAGLGIGALTGVGGLEGAIYGSLLGGFAGFRGSTGEVGFFQQIADNSKAAKEEVVSLTKAQADLRKTVSDTRQEQIAARRVASTARRDPEQFIGMAPGSSIGEYERAANQIAKIDERRANNAEKLRSSYSKLSNVTATMSARAVKLTDSQVKAEVQLGEALARRSQITSTLTALTARETNALAQQAVEGRNLAVLPEIAKERMAAEKELGKVEKQIATQRSKIAERSVRLSELASDAEQRAAQQRIAISRQLNTEIAQASVLENERRRAVVTAEQARSQAIRAGAAVAREGVDSTTAAYKANVDALAKVDAQLVSATRAATAFGQAKAFVGRQVSSLVGLFGGPWGVAITGAMLLLSKFALDAQHNAQVIAQSARLINDELARMGEDTLSGGTAPTEGLLASRIAATQSELDLMLDGAQRAKEQLDRVFGEPVPTSMDPFSSIAKSFGNVVTSISTFSYAKQFSELRTLVDAYIAGEVALGDFQAQLAELKKEANNPGFNERADDAAALAFQVRNAATAQQGYNNRLAELNEVASGRGADYNAAIDALTKQLTARANLRSATEEELELLRRSEAEIERTAYAQEYLNKAREQGISVTDDLREEADAYADARIAIEAAADAEEERRKQLEASAAAQAEFAAGIARIRAELDRGATTLVDEDAAEEVDRLVGEFVKSNIQVSELKRRLEGIADTNVSAGMKDLISRILEAIPVMSRLLALFRAIPGASIEAGTITASDRVREYNRMRGVTARDTAEQLRLSRLTDEQREFETLVSELMAPIEGGMSRTREEAEALATTITANREAIDESADAAESAAKSSEEYAEAMADLRLQIESAPLGEFAQAVISTAKGMGVGTAEVQQFIEALKSGDLQSAPERMREIADAMREIRGTDLLGSVREEFATMFMTDIEENIFTALRDAGVDAESQIGRVIVAQMRLNDALTKGKDLAGSFAKDFVSAFRSNMEAHAEAERNYIDEITALVRGSDTSEAISGGISLGMTAQQLEELRRLQQQIGQGQQAGVVATEEQRNAIEQLAKSMADAEHGATAMERAFNAIGEAAGRLRDRLIDMAIDMAINGLFSLISSALGAGTPTMGYYPTLTGPALAGGGMVKGPGTGTSDSIHAWLSNGEFVVNAAATRRNLPLLQAMNDNHLSLASGGGIGTPSIPAMQFGSPANDDIGYGTLEVRLINESGNPLQAKSASMSRQGGVDVVDIVVGAFNTAVAQGKTDSAMRTYGVKRVGK